jgi:predicted membrane protein
MTMEKRNYDQRLWLGIGAIILGLLFLASNFHILDYNIRRYIFRWEVLLMFLGVLFYFGRRKRSTGIILFFIGAVFYLRDYFEYNFTFWQIFWPAVLIFAGIMIIFRHRLDRYDWTKRGLITDDSLIDEMAVFGGGDRVVTSQAFKGGKVTTVFGGLNFDMLKAKLAPGDNHIDVFCLFGGMKLIVPEGWNVKIRVMSMFGGFSDKHRYKNSTLASEPESQLIITGTVIFGGGEIKSYFD